MANIYEIDAFSASISYSKNNVVTYGGNYLYALDSITAGAFSAGEWGGTETDDKDGTVRPSFFWRPSYGTSIEQNPKITNIQFGDGYSQRTAQGINNTLLKISYTFDGCDFNRTRAISHFLTEKGGYKVFLFTPHFPHEIQKRFACLNWTENQIFYNNFSIMADFVEVPI